nr:MAG TPA: hypothetical protein [Caudoviricetes sp.]
MKKELDLVLLSSEDGARVILEATKANIKEEAYANIEDVNAAYFRANDRSYAGFQEAIARGVELQLFKKHPSGARIYLPNIYMGIREG